MSAGHLVCEPSNERGSLGAELRFSWIEVCLEGVLATRHWALPSVGASSKSRQGPASVRSSVSYSVLNQVEQFGDNFDAEVLWLSLSLGFYARLFFVLYRRRKELGVQRVDNVEHKLTGESELRLHFFIIEGWKVAHYQLVTLNLLVDLLDADRLVLRHFDWLDLLHEKVLLLSSKEISQVKQGATSWIW